jgi:predicted metal-binding membrane protein
MGSSAADLTIRWLRYQRGVLAGSLVLLAALSWTFLGARMAAPPMQPMQPPLTALMLMWWLMMVAMMLPSAAPAILLYARVRQTRRSDGGIAQPWVFLAGYLTLWLSFSLVAGLVQWLLVGESMALESRAAQSAVLISAGLYQLSPLKSACVSHCRSPAQFISRHWRAGWTGALRLGVMHGAYCLGCCWMLMTLLFVGGVMNVLWVVGLTLLVAGEKLLPGGQYLPRVSGIGLIVWGVVKAVG